MGLLSWRRSARGPDGAPKGPVSPQRSLEPPSRPEHEVIRAATDASVPDWARLPPIAPVLPEMPWVVARHFEDSLTSWQPPEQFLRPLGHSVSPAAPSGLVEGILVSAPGPAAGPPDEAEVAAPAPGFNPATASISDDQALTLASPPASSSGGAGQVWSTRSIPGPWDPAPMSSAVPDPMAPPVRPPPAGPPVQRAATTGAPSAAVETGAPPGDQATPTPEVAEAGASLSAPAGPAQDLGPPAAAGASPGPTPSSGKDDHPGASGVSGEVELVASTSLAAIAPLVVPAGPLQDGPPRLIHALTPPDLPLARLPSAALPDARPSRIHSPDAIVRIIPQESGTVGSASDQAPGAPGPAGPPAAPPEPVPIDDLSPPPPDPAVQPPQDGRPDTGPSVVEPPAAPLVSATPPLVAEMAPSPASEEPPSKPDEPALPLAQTQRLAVPPDESSLSGAGKPTAAAFAPDPAGRGSLPCARRG